MPLSINQYDLHPCAFTTLNKYPPSSREASPSRPSSSSCVWRSRLTASRLSLLATERLWGRGRETGGRRRRRRGHCWSSSSGRRCPLLFTSGQGWQAKFLGSESSSSYGELWPKRWSLCPAPRGEAHVQSPAAPTPQPQSRQCPFAAPTEERSARDTSALLKGRCRDTASAASSAC